MNISIKYRRRRKILRLSAVLVLILELHLNKLCHQDKTTMSKSSLYSYIPLILSLIILPYIYTPLQMLRQLQIMTTWKPFWHSNTCIVANCGVPAAKCFTNKQCILTVGCINACMLDNLYQPEKVAQCAYICEMTAGYENQEFLDLMKCMLDGGCLDQYPDDGPCIGTDEDADQSVTKMEDIEGDWWVIRGVNCGDSPYPGGYDWYPCQHERFERQESGQWINNVTYCGGSRDSCDSNIIVTIANVSMPRPGVVHHDYTDAPLEPQSEDWRLVSFPHKDWALMLWCGKLPVLNYAGGIAISRHRSDENMPPEVLEVFKTTLISHGLDWGKMCPSNNHHCPV